MDELLAYKKIQQLKNQLAQVILGKEEVLTLTITALIADGHLLFEDVPGVGKTTLIKALAQSIGGEFSRIQFTPDLLPADILGTTIFNSQKQDFEFKPGPVFTTVLLADEINRATPRAQAALLEVMNEKQVTLDGTTYPLAENFFVLATQNPLEYEGTYPLPEAQLDRFLFRLNIGYPDAESELALLKNQGPLRIGKTLAPVISLDELSEIKKLVQQVNMDDSLYAYGLALVKATRNHPEIFLGVSPRGAMAFIQGAKAYAVVSGRNYCLPDDLKAVFLPACAHRIYLNAGDFLREKNEAVLAEILNKTAVPR
ncbi:AAA family ATPase [Enterococcus timonensis]|uniref:AAA family ATPase n=1 Tax=Enterococcus timonensis TaxID=1852364 RepID=UPI0008D97A98|nr:MoxR family ATPase [Enterococcus timonensis]